MPLPAFLIAELKPLIQLRKPDQLLFPAPLSGPLRAHDFRSRDYAKGREGREAGHVGSHAQRLVETDPDKK